MWPYFELRCKMIVLVSVFMETIFDLRGALCPCVESDVIRITKPQNSNTRCKTTIVMLLQWFIQLKITSFTISDHDIEGLSLGLSG